MMRNSPRNSPVEEEAQQPFQGQRSQRESLSKKEVINDLKQFAGDFKLKEDKVEEKPKSSLQIWGYMTKNVQSLSVHVIDKFAIFVLIWPSPEHAWRF